MSLNSLSGTASHTSLSLLQAAQANDHEAWRRIVELYSRRIYRWCRQARLQPEDASDVTQEVFRSVARKLVDFQHTRDQDTFRGWLRRITQNKIRDFQAHRPGRLEVAAGGTQAQRIMSELPEILPEGSSNIPSRDPGQPQACSWALQVVQAEVSGRDWQVFWRVVVDGQTTREAGEQFQMTSNAVRLVKMRILRRLRELLGDRRPELE